MLRFGEIFQHGLVLGDYWNELGLSVLAWRLPKLYFTVSEQYFLVCFTLIEFLGYRIRVGNTKNYFHFLQHDLAWPCLHWVKRPNQWPGGVSTNMYCFYPMVTLKILENRLWEMYIHNLLFRCQTDLVSRWSGWSGSRKSIRWNYKPRPFMCIFMQGILLR